MIEQIIFLIVTFVFSAILGKYFIPVLKKLKVGQNERQEGPRTHLRKQGTPTMGGIMIIISLIVMVLVYVLGILRDFEKAKPILALLFASVGFGIVGFVDDYKKVVKKNTDGLNPKLKMFGLLIISVLYTVFLVKFTSIGTGIIIPFTNFEFMLPLWVYIPFTIVVMLATTNAINLTDGVDGLAGSVSTIIVLAIAIIANKLLFPEVAMFSLILAGAIMGFLIYNFHKAKVMMGDTGSLFLGGAISSILIYLKMPLFLLILAIIPVIETLSVILQVLSFRLRGKRIFKMAPLHHHFELTGWRENRVVGVFSFITFIASVLVIFIV